jgi:hypothetical protein
MIGFSRVRNGASIFKTASYLGFHLGGHMENSLGTRRHKWVRFSFMVLGVSNDTSYGSEFTELNGMMIREEPR